jgi:branched-chain amino acid transport system ATP-binding protein
MENEILLQINNISVVYSDVIQVLKGVSLSVEKNRIISLLGSNGAGKTTTLKAISGLLKPENGKVTDGSILYHGDNIQNSSPEEITRKGIIQVLEGREPFKYLTIEENLKVGTATRWMKPYKKDLEMVYDYFPALVKRRKSLAGYCSGGELQMSWAGHSWPTRNCCSWMNLPWDLPPWWSRRSFVSSAGSTRNREPPSFSWSRTPTWPCR